MKPPSVSNKTNPIKANFTYPQRGKTEFRCRFSEVRYLSSAFCFLSSVHVHRALAVCFAGFIHVNSALCLFYHFNCLGYLVQLWDLEKFATLTAVYPSVSGTTIKQPGTATSRALSDNLHLHIPYAKSQIPKRNNIRNQINQNILSTDSIVNHNKFPSCPIISPEHKRYRLRHKKTGSVAKVGKIFLDLSARIC